MRCWVGDGRCELGREDLFGYTKECRVEVPLEEVLRKGRTSPTTPGNERVPRVL